MKALVQKVKSSSVSVDGKIINSIGSGLNVLLGVNVEDTQEDAIKLAKKVLNLRIFEDENDVMNKTSFSSSKILKLSTFLASLIASSWVSSTLTPNNTFKPLPIELIILPSTETEDDLTFCTNAFIKISLHLL